MKISFIIPSVDRDKELQECISCIEKAYERAKDVDIEILVVFQGKEENKTIKTNHPELSTFYCIKKKGLSLARNFAIRKSTGEYLVFLDDDAAIKEDFLDALSKNISIIGAGAFCGKIIDPIKNQYYATCFLENKCKRLNRFEFRYFMGSAHVLKKTVIEKIGFYDERFGAGAQYPAAEESDIFFRMKHEGEEIIYHPKLIFYHPLNCVTSALKRFNYSYAVGAMITKQAFTDSSHLFIYLFIIIEIVFKSFLRVLQGVFFLKSIETKNARFRYRSVLMGTLKGAWDYIWNLQKI